MCHIAAINGLTRYHLLSFGKMGLVRLSAGVPASGREHEPGNHSPAGAGSTSRLCVCESLAPAASVTVMVTE